MRDLQRAHIALGDGVKKQYPSETAPLNKMTKRIVAKRDLPAGHVLTQDDLDYMIPVEAKITKNALPPKFVYDFYGKTLVKAVPAQEVVGWEEIGQTGPN